MLDFKKMNGNTDTNTLKDMKGLSNLKLNGSKNQGFKPTIVDDSAVNQSIFLEGNKINNNKILVKLRTIDEIIFVVNPGSVKWVPP